jgi:ketosteroid isomerase-like protein
VDEARDEDEALAANSAFYAAFNAKHAAAMDAVWSGRPDLTCIHPGWNLLSGREAVLESWRSILGNPEQPTIVAAAVTTFLLGAGDVAVVLVREVVAGNPLLATNVFVREDGGWRLLHHQSGPVLQLND